MSLSSDAAASLRPALTRAALAAGSLAASNHTVASGRPPRSFARSRRMRAESISAPGAALDSVLARIILARSIARPKEDPRSACGSRPARARACCPRTLRWGRRCRAAGRTPGYGTTPAATALTMVMASRRRRRRVNSFISGFTRAPFDALTLRQTRASTLPGVVSLSPLFRPPS